MAILKHFSYYAPRYADALEYVVYRHDEKTKEPILDENGNRMRREDFIIDGLNCTPLSFPITAKFLNDRYRKNEPGRDVCMGQYIISYNPLDKLEGLLDTQRAHELSMEYLRECFPGIVGIACTHGDGDHHAGNIHTHFYYCTVKYSDEYSHTMKYPEHAAKGQKLSAPFSTRREYREKLAELVDREGLHPDPLMGIAEDRISHGEYWSREYHQKKLDEENLRIIESGGTPTTLIFKTEKERLREAIRDAAGNSRTMEEYRMHLERDHGVRLTEEKGFWRYGFLDSERSFSAVSLGSRYLAETVLNQLEHNRLEPTAELPHVNSSNHDAPEPDLESLEGCKRYLASHFENPFASETAKFISRLNLSDRELSFQLDFYRRCARAVFLVEEEGLHSLQDVLDTRGILYSRTVKERLDLQAWQKKLPEAENLRYWESVLRKFGSLRMEMENASDPNAFRAEHEAEFLELEYAEEKLKDLPDATEKTLRDRVLEIKGHILRLQRTIDQQTVRCSQLLEAFNDLHEIVEAMKIEAERERREEAEREAQRSERRHIIRDDYER